MERMKIYRKWLIGGAILLTALIAFIIWYSQQTPEKALTQFITEINAGNYEKAYDSLLTKEAKEHHDRQYFIDRYTNIYHGINAQNITISNITKKEEESGSDYAMMNFTIDMDTIAGHCQQTNGAHLNKEGMHWKISWDDGMIMNGLFGGDAKVYVRTTPAERGNIYDRNGSLLAGKTTQTEVGIVPGRLNPATRDADLQTIATLLGTTVDAINADLSQGWVTDDVQVPIATIDINNTDLQNQLLAVQGIYTDTTEVRAYPLGEKAAHLTGYVQNISAEELSEKQAQGDYTYSENSVIGKTGLEAAYEDRLHGQDGCRIEIDRGMLDVQLDDGTWIQKPDTWTVVETPAQNGEDVTVTIDSNIQTRLYDQFSADKSAAVVMNPLTGEVLALVSTPSYDPNAFIQGLSDDAWNALNADPNLPLVNRFESSFAPGSSFKPVTAAIGMTAGVLDPNADFGPSGLSWQKDSSWGDLTITTLQAYDGPANLANALIYSDNIYFAKAALQIGSNTLSDGMTKAGFGQTLDFPLPLTVSQISNSGSFTDEGQLAQSGFGQGEILANPVHMASIYSAFINNGNMVKPVLEYSGTPQMLYEGVFTPEAAEILRNDLVQVVENPAGTAHDASVEGLILAGKTGTAEIKASQEDTSGTENGWFNAFTADPSHPNPMLVVSMVENVKDRGGSHYLLPKVRSMFE